MLVKIKNWIDRSNVFHWNSFCFYNSSSRIFVRHFWKKMDFCCNFVYCFDFCHRIYFSKIYRRTLYLYVFFRNNFSRKSYSWSKLCLRISKKKLDRICITYKLVDIWYFNYNNCYIFSIYIKKSCVFRNCYFIFSNISLIINSYCIY